MKKLVLPLAILLGINYSAQTSQLWGVTESGAQNNYGSIYQLDGDGESGQLRHSFSADYRQSTYPKYTMSSDGLIYGVTTDGGANDFGTIFSIDTLTNNYTSLIELSNPTLGYSPSGEIVEHTNGDLYMVMTRGGANNYGAIVSYSPVSNTITKRFDLTNLTGNSSLNGLSKAIDGNFYGIHRNGGDNGDGTLFRFNPTTNAYQALHSFNITNFGTAGAGSVIMTSSGKLIGTSENGGTNDDGFMFEYDLVLSQFTKLTDFNSATTGNRPHGKLIETPSGDILGTTSQGGGGSGTIFIFDTITDTFSIIVSSGLNGINGIRGGLTPLSSTEYVGLSFYSVYKFNTADTSVTVLGTLPQNPTPPNFGNSPRGEAFVYGSQKVLGYTEKSELSAFSGTVFYLEPTFGNVTTIKQMGSSIGGAAPSAGLTAYSNTKFYGSVSEGGDNGIGGIIIFDEVTGTSSLVYSFAEVDGKNVIGSMILASDSMLYGLATEGGNGGNGTLFRFDPKTNIFTNLYDFSALIGNYPDGSLVNVGDDLFGVLSLNGSTTHGAIFKYNITNSLFSIIHNFSGIQGSRASGTPLYDTLTNALYGVCIAGGTSGDGVLYKYNLGNNTYSVLKEFTSIGSGLAPLGNIVKVGDNLYGSTQTGGASNKGTIFKYNLSTTFLTPIHSFSSAPFGVTNYELLKTKDDRIFGVRSGGLYSRGYIYEVDAINDSLRVSYDLFSEGSGVVNKLMEVTFTCQETSGVLALNNCDSVQSPSGIWYSQTGVYSDTIVNEGGCDSVIEFTVTIYPNYELTIADTACSSYTWGANSQTYTQSGQYIANLSTFAGCDSTITLNLVINSIDLTINNLTTNIEVIETGATYKWLDCDSGSIEIIGATNQDYLPSSNGSYACEISKNGCIDTTSCVNYTTASIFELSNEFTIYPNPTNGMVNFSKVLAEIKLLDANGKLIKKYNNVNQIDLSNLDEGVYLIRTEGKLVRISKI